MSVVWNATGAGRVTKFGLFTSIECHALSVLCPCRPTQGLRCFASSQTDITLQRSPGKTLKKRPISSFSFSPFASLTTLHQRAFAILWPNTMRRFRPTSHQLPRASTIPPTYPPRPSLHARGLTGLSMPMILGTQRAIRSCSLRCGASRETEHSNPAVLRRRSAP